MKNSRGLVDPVEGFEEGTDQHQEKAGKEPGHDLGIDVVLAGLPVGKYAQATDHASDGRDDQHEVTQAEIPTLYFSSSLVELLDSGLGKGRKRQGKKKDSRGCLYKNGIHKKINKEWLW